MADVEHVSQQQWQAGAASVRQAQAQRCAAGSHPRKHAWSRQCSTGVLFKSELQHEADLQARNKPSCMHAAPSLLLPNALDRIR